MIPVFDMSLEWRVLSMINGGIKTTKELAEENGVSFEEIEELQRSDSFLAPQNREASRLGGTPTGEGNKNMYWNISDTGQLIIETDKIPIYPTPINVKRYFDVDEKRNKRFVPEWLAKDIMKQLIVKTTLDNGEIFYYNGGSFRDGGEKIINWFTRKLLGNMATRNRENEVLAHISSVTPTRREVFDSNIYRINLINGVYDIKSGSLLPHTPKDMMTVQTPLEFSKDADCQKIKKFVSEIVEKDSEKNTIQEMFGYCLLRDYRFHKIFVMLGEGANGKSTLLELLKKFLGHKNVSAVSLQDIDRNRFAPARLYGKLANIYADLSDKGLEETGRLKTLSGGDSIDAEKKFKGYFEFLNYAKLIFSANRLPSSIDDSDAYFRRFTMIQFEKQFLGDERDPKILEKLTTKDELSGCFNWAIEGLNRLLENGCFSNDCDIESTRKLYRKLSSPIAAFAENMLEEDENSDIPKEEMYAQFVQFCKKNRMIPVSKNLFTKTFQAESNMIVRETRPKVGKKQIRCWGGVRLKNMDMKQVTL
jgi:putative DNA primase/helicase